MQLDARRDTTADPLNSQRGGTDRWTTRNFSEAMPGVPTALSWSIWGSGMQFASVQDYRWMGAFSRAELSALERGDRRASDIFHGHVAGNVDIMSEAVARMPGSTPESFERDFFGLEPNAQTPKQTRRRWPIILPKLVMLQLRHPGRLTQLAAETDAWWRRLVASSPTPESAKVSLEDAAERFKMAMAIHSIQTTFAQAAFGKIAKIAAAAGASGAEMDLATGSGALEELHVARDLWRLSRGEITMDSFVADHGYHGPNEGELSARSWREDRTPVVTAAEAFGSRTDDEGPDAHVGRKDEARRAALDRVLAGTTGRKRASMQRAVEKAAREVALREVGKAAFLKILDGGRFAARRVGADLVQRGELEDADDVFHLTLDELGSGTPAPLREIVAVRRATRQQYLGLTLPEYWVGTPDPVAVNAAAARDGSIVGLAASAGVVEGRARVVLDADDDDQPLGHDEILVACTTDPGWLSLFMGAGGMVVDVGGPMSHAAIVARELDIPCVINTVDGSRRIRTGDLLRVDGSAGTVEILGHA